MFGQCWPTGGTEYSERTHLEVVLDHVSECEGALVADRVVPQLQRAQRVIPSEAGEALLGDVEFTCILANKIRRSACPLLHASPSRAYLRSLDLEADVV